MPFRAPNLNYCTDMWKHISTDIIYGLFFRWKTRELEKKTSNNFVLRFSRSTQHKESLLGRANNLKCYTFDAVFSKYLYVVVGESGVK
jgi:hypothetical protein